MNARALLVLSLAFAVAGALVLGLLRTGERAPAASPRAVPEALGGSTAAPTLREPASATQRDVPAAGGTPRAAGGQTRRGASLSGRVLDHAGEPVAGAAIGYRLARMVSPPPKEAATGADGRFALELARDELGVGQLLVRSSSSGGRHSQQVDVPAAGLELGDIVLEARCDLHFVVRSSHGAALAGAEVESLARGEPASARSDEQGRGVLRGLPVAHDVLGFSAPDHWLERVALRPGVGTRQAPLEVVLRPVPALVVEVRFDDGSSPRGFRLRVVFAEPASFVDASGGRSKMPPHADLWTGFGGFEDGTWLESISAPDRDGRMEIPALDPSSAGEVAVLDGALREVARRRFGPGQIAMRQPVVFELEGPPKELVVLAEGAGGEPLRRFELRALGVDEPKGTSVVRGSASLRDLVGSRIDLVVHAEGLEPAVVRDIQLLELRNEVLVRLGEGLPLRVRATGADGLPVEVREVVLELGLGIVATSREPGPDRAHRFEGMPAHPIVAHALVHSRWSRCVHDPRRGDLDLKPPHAGAVLVRFERGVRFAIQLVGLPPPEGVPAGRLAKQGTQMLGHGDTVRLRLAVLDPQGSGEPQVVSGQMDLERGGIRIDGVEPGTRVLVLEWAPEAPRPIVQRTRPLEVRAGEVTEVLVDTSGVRWR